MAAVARDAGVAQRPHAKTHKTREVAERQLAHGAIGLTVAKLGEAEAMVDAGFDDLFVAYPLVGEMKLTPPRRAARSGADPLRGRHASSAREAASAFLDRRGSAGRRRRQRRRRSRDAPARPRRRTPSRWPSGSPSCRASSSSGS